MMMMNMFVHIAENRAKFRNWCEEEEEEELCLFNIVCSYTNSAMLITYTCRETPNGWNLISRLQGAT